MKIFFRYIFLSTNKETYRSIARKLKTNPLQVHRLAHGKIARTNKDYQILKQLKEHDIIESLLHFR